MELHDILHGTRQIALGAIVGLSLVGGCSSAGRGTEPPPPRFVTYIDAEGVKHFMLMVEGGPPGRRRGPPPGGGPGGPSGPGGMGGPPPGGPGGGPPGGRGGKGGDPGMEERMKAGLYRMLTDRLAETGYCRDSYQETDSSFGASGSRIAGRCNETATDLDRTTFPNDQP